MRGLFITMEGMDGCGKSTQLKRLARALAERGLGVAVTREPGGTPAGEAVRALLSSEASLGIAPLTELFLIVGARAEHVASTIKPALAQGGVIMSDRYVDSTVAFQGYGRGLDLALIDQMNAAATGGLMPDLTLLLDLDPEIARARTTARPVGGLLGAFDEEQLDFHARVRRGYLELARRLPRITVIEASGSSDDTHAAIMEAVLPLISSRASGGGT
jgi:dTMP kinase